MKFNKLVLLLSIAVSCNAMADSIDVCSNPSELHKQKMEKYGMNDVPSLLKDCGLDAIFSASGIFDIFKSFSLSIPSMDLLCGYTTTDVLDWYGVDSDYQYDVGVSPSYDINHDFLSGEGNFFTSTK